MKKTFIAVQIISTIAVIALTWALCHYGSVVLKNDEAQEKAFLQSIK